LRGLVIGINAQAGEFDVMLSAFNRLNDLNALDG
jgi:hypothetical protein